jgi:hypothetical protein
VIVAWHEVPGTGATPKEPSRRVRSDSYRCALQEMVHHREAIEHHRTQIFQVFSHPQGLAALDHTVPYGTALSRDAFPGTSCLATIAPSLRDTLAAISQQHLICLRFRLALALPTDHR